MKDHKVAPLTCPACAAQLNGALNTSSERLPREGDPTICVYCRAILLFVGEPVHSLRRPDLQEEIVLLLDPGLQRAVAALNELHRRGPLK